MNIDSWLSKYNGIIPTVLLIGIVSLSIYLTWNYSINFPLNPDDATVCLGEFPSNLNIVSVFEYIFTTKNGHPQIIERLFSVFSYILLNEVNFTFINVASVIAIFGFILIVHFKLKNWNVTLVGSALLLSFQPIIFLWPSASAVYFFAYAFAIISLLLITAEMKVYHYFLLALTTFLCILSFGNGIAIVPCLAVYLIVRHFLLHDVNSKMVIGVLSVIILDILIYKLVIHNDTSISLFISQFLEDPMRAIYFIIEMNGSVLKYLNILSVSNGAFVITTSLILLAACLVVLFRTSKFTPELIIAITILLFCITSSAMAAIGRAYDDGSGLANRYEFNSVFVLYGFFLILYFSNYLSRTPKISVGILLLLFSFNRTYSASFKDSQIQSKENYLVSLSNYILSGYTEKAFIHQINDASLAYKTSLTITNDVKKSIESKLFQPNDFLINKAEIFKKDNIFIIDYNHNEHVKAISSDISNLISSTLEKNLIISKAFFNDLKKEYDIQIEGEGSKFYLKYFLDVNYIPSVMNYYKSKGYFINNNVISLQPVESTKYIRFLKSDNNDLYVGQINQRQIVQLYMNDENGNIELDKILFDKIVQILSSHKK